MAANEFVKSVTLLNDNHCLINYMETGRNVIASHPDEA